MDARIERRESQSRQDVGLAIAIALAIQGSFAAALALADTVLAIPLRLVLGLLSVPVSALCGTLFFRSRRRERSNVHLAILFCSLVAIVVVAGFLFSAVTGNYDLP